MLTPTSIVSSIDEGNVNTLTMFNSTGMESTSTSLTLTMERLSSRNAPSCLETHSSTTSKYRIRSVACSRLHEEERALM